MPPSNPWSLAAGGWKANSQAIGTHVEKFIGEIPQWAIYVRRDLRFDCPTHKLPSTEGTTFFREHCPFCWGTGFKTSFQLVPCKVSLGKGALGREGTVMDVPGLLARFSVTVDFPRTVYPKFDDFIITAEWNLPVSELPKATKPKPLRINNIYMLKQINDHFEREISWFNCGCEVYEIDKAKVEAELPYLQDIEVLNTAWQQNSYW